MNRIEALQGIIDRYFEGVIDIEELDREIATLSEHSYIDVDKYYQESEPKPDVRREEQLARSLDKENGERTPGGDLFRELANPEYRYHYIKAVKATDGQLVGLRVREAIAETARTGIQLYPVPD